MSVGVVRTDTSFRVPPAVAGKESVRLTVASQSGGLYQKRMACSLPERVLLLDDDTDTLETLREVLLFAGVTEVNCTSSVTEAVATIRCGFRPCVVVLDLKLGTERGESLLYWLREDFEDRTVQAVAVSGDRAGLDCLVDTVATRLLKPATVPELLSALAEAWLRIGPAPPRRSDPPTCPSG